VSAERQRKVLVAACIAALAAMVLMLWSLVDPSPAPVMVAMMLGQVLGTISLAAFLAVVLLDLRRGQRAIEEQVVDKR
jgi:preprotein translocase subunit SecF